MAKKKVTKRKVAKKVVAMKEEQTCSTGSCNCKGFLALVIIALTWWQPAVMWSQITITIAAAIILLTAHGCYCKK